MQTNIKDIESKFDPFALSTMQTTEYANILRYFNLNYIPTEFYLQVGNILWVQGWILHISVVISQVSLLFKAVLPILISEKVSFKIVSNKNIAKDLLDGHLGYINLGKLICIYPNNETNALTLAQKLVNLTSSLKGPAVPTDIKLGGCVYARYGSGNPIFKVDALGKTNKFIYNHVGKLVPDSYAIPFALPQGIYWPFSTITKPYIPISKKTIRYTYKPIKVIKPDARGYVWQALYLKGWMRTIPCIIKQGKQNMCSDDFDRDIRDRLLWQQRLHKTLEGIVPLPKIIDLFEELGDTYLVMEIIKGISLHEYRQLINKGYRIWFDLSKENKLALINHILTIISSIESLHENGYVHRDITPSNFLINEKGTIILIDIELAYLLDSKSPTPPFGIGTPGFMSPEQSAEHIPTVKEDIYGLCATILWVLTGISPRSFQIENTTDLKKSLFFFIHDAQVAKLIAEALNPNPLLRPELQLISKTIRKFQQNILEEKTKNKKGIHIEALNHKELRETIQGGIHSLVKPPILMFENLWLSKIEKTETIIGNVQKAYSLNPGFHEGISGIMYFLSRAKTCGFDIDSCIYNYNKGWDFLSNILSQLPNTPLGLYNGAAGIALAMISGFKAGLLKGNTDNLLLLQRCFELETSSFDLATGIAGQGASILQCQSYLSNDIVQSLLSQRIKILLDNQEKSGFWHLQSTSNTIKGMNSVGFGYGVGGITWFLLNYIEYFPNESIRKAATKALEWLDKKTHHLKIFNNIQNEKMIDPYINQRRTGVILTFIKAYESLKDPIYQKLVEDVLFSIPICIISNNFSQAGGLAGWGEIYLEAARVFKNLEWQRRAEWIVKVFLRICIKSNNRRYWLGEETPFPTAGLILGNSGILHFLMRYESQNELGYRLLS